MFTPVFASGKCVGQLIFGNQTQREKSDFWMLKNSKNPKKSNKVGEKKYLSLCMGVEQGNYQNYSCPVVEFSCPTPIHNGPRQANLVFIAYASSEGSGVPAHSLSLARTSAGRSYKQ